MIQTSYQLRSRWVLDERNPAQYGWGTTFPNLTYTFSAAEEGGQQKALERAEARLRYLSKSHPTLEGKQEYKIVLVTKTTTEEDL